MSTAAAPSRSRVLQRVGGDVLGQRVVSRRSRRVVRSSLRIGFAAPNDVAKVAQRAVGADDRVGARGADRAQTARRDPPARRRATSRAGGRPPRSSSGRPGASSRARRGSRQQHRLEAALLAHRAQRRRRRPSSPVRSLTRAARAAARPRPAGRAPARSARSAGAAARRSTRCRRARSPGSGCRLRSTGAYALVAEPGEQHDPPAGRARRDRLAPRAPARATATITTSGRAPSQRSAAASRQPAGACGSRRAEARGQRTALRARLHRQHVGAGARGDGRDLHAHRAQPDHRDAVCPSRRPALVVHAVQAVRQRLHEDRALEPAGRRAAAPRATSRRARVAIVAYSA